MNTFESSSFKRAFPLIQYNKDREHTFKDANNYCNNCGKTGHSFSQCKHPITSIGLIVFRKVNNDFQYLMIRRKDSLGYVDFMRGKYPLHNKLYLKNIFSEMTNEEKDKLLNKDFYSLWNELWGDHIGIQYRGEEKISFEKFKGHLVIFFSLWEITNRLVVESHIIH